MTRKLILVAITTAAAVLSAKATGIADNTLTVDAGDTYALSDDVTVQTLDAYSSSTIDLNGHNLTVGDGSKGILKASADSSTPALITNSVSGTTSKMLFKLTQNIGSQEFSRLQFGGNLELTLRDVTFNESTGFGDHVNTHTGGTILDNVKPNGGTASLAPRIKNVNGLGSGDLTLRNGSSFRLISSGGTLPWANIVAESGTNCFYAEKQTTFTGNVVVSNSAAFYLLDGRDGVGTWEGANYDGVAAGGSVGFSSTSTTAGKAKISSDIAGSLKVGGTAQFRFTRSTGGDWTLGDLSSFDDETEPVSQYWIRTGGGSNTDSAYAVNVVVGSANLDSTYWGSFKEEQSYNVGQHWKITKIGTGTWTIGGTNNNYSLGTVISNGAIKLTGANATLGTGEIVFAGGSLAFASDGATSFANLLVATNAVLAVDVGEDCAVTNTASVGSITAAIEKSGEGAFVFSGAFSNTSDPFRNSALTNYVYGVLEMPMPTDGTPSLASTLLGDGILRFTGATDSKGYRLNSGSTAEALSEFEGTIDWNYTGTASTAIGLVFADNNAKSWPSLRWSITGEPSSERVVCHMEQSANLTLKAFDILHANAQVSVKNAKNLYFGASGEDSTLNGQFITSAIYIHKSGTGKLTMGPGFSAVSGSTLGVEAGVLELASGATYEGVTNVCTVTIASGVALTGDGVFGAVDLSVNDVVAPDASSITDKTAEYSILTATSFSNVDSSSNLSTLLSALNEGETKGKWRFRLSSNGDGTVTLKCVYSKNAFVIVLR